MHTVEGLPEHLKSIEHSWSTPIREVFEETITVDEIIWDASALHEGQKCSEILNRGRDKVCPTISTLARLHPCALGRERQLLESPSNRMVRVSQLELGAESALQLLSLCQTAGLPV
jgi:hypothetical protein